MLITDDYKAQQETLHENPNYGVASRYYAPQVSRLIDMLQIDEMLDYGCGKGRLGQSIQPRRAVLIDHYDPSIPEFSETPQPREFVACIDVLEHIEPDLLDNVLDDLQRVTERYGFFTIHTGPAVKTLPDGRNAHLIQEDFRWWLPRIWQRFDLVSMTKTQNGFFVVVQNVNKHPSTVETGDKKLVTPD